MRKLDWNEKYWRGNNKMLNSIWRWIFLDKISAHKKKKKWKGRSSFQMNFFSLHFLSLEDFRWYWQLLLPNNQLIFKWIHKRSEEMKRRKQSGEPTKLFKLDFLDSPSLISPFYSFFFFIFSSFSLCSGRLLLIFLTLSNFIHLFSLNRRSILF